jgi:uncharacterized protein (TIGR02145 family)
LGNYAREFTVSGLQKGIYFINVRNSTCQFSGKLISTGNSGRKALIESGRDNISVDNKKSETDVKGVTETIDMAYTSGDRLKFTGISGNYSTVITDIPSENKPIEFNFVSCTDGDGNHYPVVTIGTQLWMAENLKTTKYNDNASISLETDNMAWNNLTSPAYCWYNNNGGLYKDIYGALYNAYAVATGKLCPSEWHIPSNAEWTTLSSALGSSAGGKMKEAGSVNWTSPNTGATNASGFTGRPGGARAMGGIFSEMNGSAYWWSSTEMPPMEYWSRSIFNWDAALFSGPGYKSNGYSVRCVKD